MEKFGNFLRANIQDLQTRVEEALEVELGNIDILPLPKYIQEWMAQAPPMSNFLRHVVKIIGTCYIYSAELFFGNAKAGNSTIYYSRGPQVLIMSDRAMTEAGLHELVHIAHARLMGRPVSDILSVPEHITEGFAMHVARRITQNELGLKTPSLFWSFGLSSYHGHYKKFEEEILRKGVTDYKQLKDMVLSYRI